MARLIFAIARHAERNGSGTPLLPTSHLAEITRWNDRSNDALTAGRINVITRMSADREAQQEALPRFIPRALRPALTGAAQLTVRSCPPTHVGPEPRPSRCARPPAHRRAQCFSRAKQPTFSA